MSSNSILDAVADSLSDVLKGHYAEKKRVERERTVRTRPSPLRAYQPTVKVAVFHVMKEAASKASANFTLPYSVRQLYYQVRPLIQDYTSKELNYVYFTPPLVTEYEEIYGPLQGLIYEPRGHLIEPHRDIEVPLGTVDVAGYEIPDYEYDKILYIEKEGFNQIFDTVKLGQRYDMALMTAKGFATRAAKLLLSHASGKDIAILAAHDADISGYEIVRTLKNETRTTRGMNIDVIDLGLTVKEALDMGLVSENVVIQKEPSHELLYRLTSEEREFLLGTHSYYKARQGKRVELNAMTTGQLITWLEDRLKDFGLQTKVLPPAGVVEDELKNAIESKLDDDVRQMVKKAIEELLGAAIADIEEEVRKEIGVPESSGYYEELEQYLDGCPPEYWRDWISDKAAQLEASRVKDKKSIVSEFLSQHLGEKTIKQED
ncbi:hypothetical protein M1O47_03520 [Dehalococcoidia bacterium]|nr:hypothetical protein [Dehalococcoidia bacterium]